jgi:hypothetical protein
MKEIFKYVSDYLTGRSIYSPIVRSLNFYLSASITSALFKWVYFNYTLIDITDYKGIYNYFIGGDFAVPLILFTLVHYGIGILSESLFYLLTFLISSKWTRLIFKIKVSKKRYYAVVKSLNNNPVFPRPLKIDKGVLIRYFEAFKNAIPQEAWEKARLAAELKKEQIKNNFKLAFKGIIALTVFLITVPYFGRILYSVAVVLNLAGLVFFIYTYVLLDISPLLIKRIDAEMTKLVEEFEAAVESEQR